MRCIPHFLLFMLMAPGLFAQPDEWVKVEANPAKGFSWPYYLALYNPPATNTVLLIVPNDSPFPSDDPLFHDEYARSGLSFYSGYVKPLKAPALAPVFPRPANHPEIDDIQALSNGAFTTKIPGLERIDLQLIAMIEDARTRLAARGIVIDKKVWFMGGSAMGSFASRFTTIHPELVKATSIMSPMWGPLLPVAEWKGEVLNFPVGIADLRQVAGTDFNLDAYRRVPQFFWVGDEDRNNNQLYYDQLAHPTTDPEVPLIAELFGGPENYVRWPRYETVFKSAGCDLTRFTIFPGFGHGSAPALMTGAWLWQIFSLNQGPEPAIFDKPMSHDVYLPNFPVGDMANTEITIVNQDPEIPAKGMWLGYVANGSTALDVVTVTIPPLGKRSIVLAKAFPHWKDLGFFRLMSDSGFLAVYSTYSSHGRRFTAPAARANRLGELPRIPADGWTGLALINGDISAATVRLSAVDDEGREVAARSLTFPSERRGGIASIAGTAEEIFGASLGSATHIRYSSDRLICVFLLGGSADGSLVGAVTALPEPVR